MWQLYFYVSDAPVQFYCMLRAVILKSVKMVKRDGSEKD